MKGPPSKVKWWLAIRFRRIHPEKKCTGRPGERHQGRESGRSLSEPGNHRHRGFRVQRITVQVSSNGSNERRLTDPAYQASAPQALPGPCAPVRPGGATGRAAASAADAGLHGGGLRQKHDGKPVAGSVGWPLCLAVSGR